MSRWSQRSESVSAVPPTVPLLKATDCAPEAARTSSSFSAIRSRASSQLHGSQPGSGSVLGRVRRSGTFTRSRWSWNSAAARPSTQIAPPYGCARSGSTEITRGPSAVVTTGQCTAQNPQYPVTFRIASPVLAGVIAGLSVTRVYRRPLPYSTRVTSLAGVVTSGLGQGAYFMSLPWVRDAVRRLIGFTPYPGTLNIRLDADALAAWRSVRGQALPSKHFEGVGTPCGARLFPAVIGPDIEAAIIVPDVTRYGDDLLELLAGIHLRSRLGLRDDDRVALQLL